MNDEDTQEEEEETNHTVESNISSQRGRKQDEKKLNELHLVSLSLEMFEERARTASRANPKQQGQTQCFT